MVLEKLFAGVANTFLGGYIENIDSKDMSFGLGGTVWNSDIFIVENVIVGICVRRVKYVISEVE